MTTKNSVRVALALAMTGVLLVPAHTLAADGATAARSKKQSDIRRATARLNGTRLTRFTQSGMSSFDQRLHFCGDKSFIYDTVSSIEGGIVDPDVRRVTGHWRVTSAKINGRVCSAKVRGTPDDGSPALTVTVRTDGNRTTVDGNVVIAERSDLC
jgi:hypothetical protein